MGDVGIVKRIILKRNFKKCCGLRSVAQDRVKCWAVVDMIVNVPVILKAHNVFIS